MVPAGIQPWPTASEMLVQSSRSWRISGWDATGMVKGVNLQLCYGIQGWYLIKFWIASHCLSLPFLTDSRPPHHQGTSPSAQWPSWGSWLDRWSTPAENKVSWGPFFAKYLGMAKLCKTDGLGTIPQQIKWKLCGLFHRHPLAWKTWSQLEQKRLNCRRSCSPSWPHCPRWLLGVPQCMDWTPVGLVQKEGLADWPQLGGPWICWSSLHTRIGIAAHLKNLNRTHEFPIPTNRTLVVNFGGPNAGERINAHKCLRTGIVIVFSTTKLTTTSCSRSGAFVPA